MAGNWLIRKGQSKVISFVLIMGLLLGSIVPVVLSTTPVYADIDISAEVNAAIAEVKGHKSSFGVGVDPDWILTMVAAGLKEEITDEELDEYLTIVIDAVSSLGAPDNIGSYAKHAMALTALGIDPCNIPDDMGNSVNLIKWLAESKPASSMDKAYEAPFVLMLFNLENYDLLDYPDRQFTKETLLQHILDGQKAGTSLWHDEYDDWITGDPVSIPSAEVTSLALLSLAKYYHSSEEMVDGVTIAGIRIAADNAIGALSPMQTHSGGFLGWLGVDSASSASTVAAGLISLDFNPHTEGTFKKNGLTLIDNLISFRIPGQGLEDVQGGGVNAYASLFGFQALTVFRNLTSIPQGITNIYNVNKEVGEYDDWLDEKLIKGIAVTQKPTDLEYEIGSNETDVNIDGIGVTAYYKNDIFGSRTLAIGEFSVTKINASSSGTKKVTVNYKGHTATFNVIVKNADNSAPTPKTAKLTVKDAEKNVIVSDNAYPIEPNSTTVLDVLKAVLTEKGKPYTIIGSYVSSINDLSEFDEGENSGWLYYVGGKDPGKSAADYTLKGGENILWFYTLDFTQESGAEKWIQGSTGQQASAPVTKDDLDAALKDIESGKADSWTADTANGSVSFDKDALEGLIDEMGKDTIEVTIEPTPAKDLTVQQKEVAGDRPVFDINVLIGKKEVSSFKGKLTISIPYKLKEGELATGIVVYHINDKGELTLMEGHYDPATGNVIFIVDHLSLYVIAYDATKAVWPFTDVKQSSDNWYYDAVKYTYEKGIFTGTSADKFSPDVSLSRAMLASVLARISGADLTKYKESGFTDVDIKSWYGPSVAWAKEVGVVSGYANKDGTFAFRPDNKISRQDIAVMIHNFNEKVQKKAYTKVAAVKFVDQGQIPEYAKAAIQAMQEAGIISGFQEKDGSYSFRPAGITSRAQAASLVYNMLTK